MSSKPTPYTPLDSSSPSTVLYVPSGHVTGSVSVLAQYIPAGHAVQLLAPSSEYCPDPHSAGTEVPPTDAQL